MLDMPVLTTVGALIGCSGAALTKIMCDAMNRDILSVILGGYGTKSSGGGEAMKFEGEVIQTSVDDTCKLLLESESGEPHEWLYYPSREVLSLILSIVLCFSHYCPWIWACCCER